MGLFEKGVIVKLHINFQSHNFGATTFSIMTVIAATLSMISFVTMKLRIMKTDQNWLDWDKHRQLDIFSVFKPFMVILAVIMLLVIMLSVVIARHYGTIVMMILIILRVFIHSVYMPAVKVTFVI